MPLTITQLNILEKKQNEKTFEACYLVIELLERDDCLLTRLFNDDLDIREELSYLGDTPTDFDDLTDSNINFIYEAALHHLQDDYKELCEEEEEEEPTNIIVS